MTQRLFVVVQGLLELWHEGSLGAPQHVGSQPGIKHTFPALEGGFWPSGPLAHQGSPKITYFKSKNYLNLIWILIQKNQRGVGGELS